MRRKRERRRVAAADAAARSLLIVAMVVSQRPIWMVTLPRLIGPLTPEVKAEAVESSSSGEGAPRGLRTEVARRGSHSTRRLAPRPITTNHLHVLISPALRDALSP